MPVSQRYSFGDFVLEPAERRVLRRDGATLNLTPRLFTALQLFVENAGKLLDKNALIQALWPDLVVDENSLSQVVSGLRRALADDTSASRYIQTVPRRGFRFIAPVTLLPQEPSDLPACNGTPGPSLQTPLAAPAAQPAGAADSPAGESDRRGWLQMAIASGVAASLAGALVWAWRRAPASVSAAPPRTLAVLPFKPLTGDGRDELLEVGMADSLIARLSLVPGLVVRSVGSVRRYAGADQDPLRAARDLDAAWIVDGSLQRRGDALRVTARLLRAADGVASWSGSFDEKYNGVFEVQDVISERVARVLAPSLEVLAGARTPPPSAGGTRNNDAYQLYLAAARYAQEMRADGMRKSVGLYRQALDIDPGYALAWVGLAEVYRRSLFAADALPSAVFEPATIAVGRALAAVPDLAEALAEQAFRLYWFDFDWASAEREFRRVLAINPNVSMAHFGLATLMLNQGRTDEGFRRMQTARELDPMSPVLNTLEAGYLLEAGRHEDARARLVRALAIAPGFWLAHCTQGVLHFADGQPDEGIARLRAATVLAEGNSRPSALLAVYLARLGQVDEARAILGRLLDIAKGRYVPPSSIAAAYAALGDATPALDALDQALLTRDTRLAFLKDDSRLAGLRKEPRFASLLHQLKLDGFGPGLAPP